MLTDRYAHSFPRNSSYTLPICVTQTGRFHSSLERSLLQSLLAGSTLILFLNFKVRSIHANALSMLTQTQRPDGYPRRESKSWNQRPEIRAELRQCAQ